MVGSDVLPVSPRQARQAGEENPLYLFDPSFGEKVEFLDSVFIVCRLYQYCTFDALSLDI